MPARPGSSPQSVTATGLGSERTDLAELLRRPAWMADALCIEYPRVDFFATTEAAVEAASAVCRRCLVRPECVAFARHERHGVWGGTTPDERQVDEVPSHARLPLLPLFEALGRPSGRRFAEATGAHRRQLQRWAGSGVTPEQAEHLARSTGLDALAVWPELEEEWRRRRAVYEALSGAAS